MNSLHNVRTGPISLVLMLFLAACGADAAVIGSGLKTDAATTKPDSQLGDVDAMPDGSAPADADAQVADTAGDGLADGLGDGIGPATPDVSPLSDGVGPVQPADDALNDADGPGDPDALSDIAPVGDGGNPNVDAYPDGYWISTNCVNRCGKPPQSDICNCDPGCVLKGDCCPDYAALCGVKNVCGNGSCEAGEDTSNCAKDCPYIKPIPAIAPCMEDACPGPWAGCMMDTKCTKYVSCYATCLDKSVTPDGTVWKCMEACKKPLQFMETSAGWAQAMADCGNKAGCLNLPENMGAICGDGICWPMEIDCPSDCGPMKPLPPCSSSLCYSTLTWWNCPECGYMPESPVDDCLIAKCGSLWKACATAGIGCMTPVKCVEAGISPATCVKAGTPQNAKDLLTCGTSNGCLKDNSNFSCQGSCGMFVAGMPCACSSECKQLGNCCKDFDSVCNGVVLCGDGVCNSLGGETSASCPVDCGTAATKPCVLKADCAADQVCCANAGGKACVPAGACL